MKPPKKDYLLDSPDKLIQEHRAILQKLQEEINNQLEFYEVATEKFQDNTTMKILVVKAVTKSLNQKLFDALVDSTAVESRARDVEDANTRRILHGNGSGSELH
ncbi:hypothetical protein H6G04_27035 [Calothrix membranacea FACHB-236]|nr:hypothetical protein [Calothrix membranacea FACHB-236]